jgi:microcystin-dependent protein
MDRRGRTAPGQCSGDLKTPIPRSQTPDVLAKFSDIRIAFCLAREIIGLMSNPYIGEIRLTSFGFPPKGWALCNGQLLPINQNQPLFSLLGTFYGGNGQTTFALPNLQGRVPMHMGTGFSLGQQGGEENHPLTISEMPAHTHSAFGSSDNGSALIADNTMVLGNVANMYGGQTNMTTLSPLTVASIGGGQGHVNMQPFLTLSFCIALQGIFPSRN